MVSITLAVPEELKKEMDKFQEMNWSAVAREAIKNKIILLNKFRQFTKESTITDEDAMKLGRSLNKSLNQRYKKLS